MHISLDRASAAIIQDKLKSARYSTAQEVVFVGLQALSLLEKIEADAAEVIESNLLPI